MVEGPPSPVGVVPVTSREQDAVRILLLLDNAGEPVDVAERTLPGLDTAVCVVRSTVRLQKLDFWLRNPDYLADELLNDYEVSLEQPLLDIAASILDSEEPEVRRYPMLRHKFGAWENIDNALAVLRGAGLAARKRRGTVERVRQSDYYLLEKGREVAREIVAAEPVFGYYVSRVRLVVQLADGLGGTQLKRRQYLQREYAETPLREHISSVAPRARARLATLRAATHDKASGSGSDRQEGADEGV
ncbi:hypothetical protein [Pseudonocardia oroxyli]|uniref:Uncharacterized protein n=1 Tax=Pseudonocardia oroxyli TaxID=366584 RepID=A0A1G8ENT7_PSEOR|nr:hypothetical protein [Pseudonocardia oroxyli]SDH71541.1 hypothetical protein SAMN05216377_1407 [Pseudonocardia oroxyli]